MFSSEYGLVLYALLILLLAGLALFSWGIVPWMRCGRLSRQRAAAASENTVEETAEMPKLSVIVYAEDDEAEIEECVKMLSRQDYPRKEIVIVSRTTAAMRDMISGRLADYKNVYVTFIPPGSHNLSERKLAITLGLKAAHGDIVLTTVTNIRPGSDHWLSDMAAPFRNSEIELVLGYSRMDFNELRGAGRWYRQFDTVLTSAQWAGYALAGKPYRGDGYNLAFRRDTFFKHRGYAGNFFLHYGDDDLFVHQIARSDNTVPVLTPDSIITTEWGESANRMWTLRKSRYQFTSRWLPKEPFMRAAAISWGNWLVLGAAVAMGILGRQMWINIAFPAFAWLAMQFTQIFAYRRMAPVFGAVRLWWAIPVFMSAHPILNSIFKLKHRSLRKVNYTWQR